MDEYLLNRDIIYSNPSLINKSDLLYRSFLADPSLIIFFKDDDLRKNSLSAVERGYIASEEDLLFNPQLGGICEIMWVTVSNSPELIKYSKSNCYFSPKLLDNVFSRYSLCLNDLYINPDLCGNMYIMKRFPEFKLYCSYLSDSEKIDAIVECIENGASIDYLPFFDYHFGSNVNVLGLSKLLSFLYISFDQDNIDFQQYCSIILEHIINGIIDIRYYVSRIKFKFPNVACLNDEILRVFDTSSDIYKLIDDIKEYVGGFLDYKVICDRIFDFYNIYLSKGTISLSDTNSFCNDVLNRHRDFYYSSSKVNIINYLSSILNLSPKKKKTIINKRKLDKVGLFISEKNFSLLGIDDVSYYRLIECLRDDILSNKIIKNSNIDSSDIDSFIDIFNSTGSISCVDIKSLVDVDNDIAEFICNRFNKFKFKFITSINISPGECNVSNYYKSKISGINYNNFLIFDRDRYIKNIANILISIDDNVLEKINFNSLNNELVYIIPFIGLFPELSVDSFINIISQYSIVYNKISSSHKKTRLSFFDYVDDFILLSNSYSSLDNINFFALGERVSSIVGTHNVNDYLYFYLSMLNRDKCFIPNVSFLDNGLKYNSGYYADPDRLLIGHIVSVYSCIKLGSDAFDEILLGNYGNVVLIKDECGELVSRLLLFRRGNFIQIVSNVANKFPIDIFEKISSQLVYQADQVGDNIDCVIVNCSSCSTLDHGHDIITDNRLITGFPHADFYNSGIVLYSRYDNVSLDFDVKPKCFYCKQRMEVNYLPSDDSINRLRALDIVLSSSGLSKKIKKDNFEPFYSKDYMRVVCGEDWYVAYGSDGSLEKLFLPNCSEESFIECNSVLEEFNDFSFRK